MNDQIKLTNLTVGYNRHPALHHINANLPLGELIAVLGNNGSGKSTLIKSLVGIIKPIAGSIEGLPASYAYLPQLSSLQRDFPITVLQMITTGILGKKEYQTTNKLIKKLLRKYNFADQTQSETAIKTVGLAGFENRTLDTLSGGQLQRALFARLIVQNASLILLDEPFTAIDQRTVTDLLELLHLWQSEGRTVIAVLHDLEMVKEHFSYSMILARELIASGKTAEVLTQDYWQLSQSFNEAYDERADWCQPKDIHKH